jgi:outer membrane cobalamin receptor
MPPTTRRLRRALIPLAACAACHAVAHDVPEDDAIALDAVTIARHYDNAVGTADAASQGVVRASLLKSRPALRPGEVLEFVPGLIVTQHSGDGKANQYFLRGFNLDHGTDFATTLDGMPLNQPTHGHGQGYTDLNFLIPELVERIEYRKGPYFATHGDFASAGAADLHYRRQFDAPFVQLTLGERGYRRGVGGASFKLREDTTLLGALEWMRHDGPWSVPEGLRRQNAVLTLSHGTHARGGALSLMAYDARWTSTDQVPERLLASGQLGRYDSLDPSDGGSTGRTSLSGEWHDRDGGGATEVSAHAMRHRLALYSNFTYAMERPARGDQFSQQDERSVYGLKASRAWQHLLGDREARTELGVQMRRDLIDVGLFDTAQRTVLATTRRDQVQQTMLSAYAQQQLAWTPWLRSVLGVRADQLRAIVHSLGNAANTGARRAHQLSPKLSLIAGPWARTEFFFNAGRGLHSNDARGTATTVDPRTGEAVDRVPALVASRGWELGARTEVLPGLQSSLALWHLRFDSELVYVGDAGATEPRGASRRRGIEWNNRWTPNHHVLLDADLAWTHARFDNGDRIPNAVDAVASVAATLRDLGPWSASLQWRYLGTGALTEDNAVRSRLSSTFNLRLSRALQDMPGRRATLTLDVFNLFDRQVDDIQYHYASRLPTEAAPVADRHVHPGEPRSVRVAWRSTF